jgi:hypothetical protein
MRYPGLFGLNRHAATLDCERTSLSAFTRHRTLDRKASSIIPSARVIGDETFH